MPHETETNEQTGPSGPDTIDQLLNNAFDQAFAVTADVDLVGVIMARIAREQRNRSIVFTLLGIVGAILPLGFTVALTALEFLVAFLQAYVFAILTCMYLNDAIHPSH